MAAARSPKPWEGIRDGSDPGPECPQLLKGPGRTVLNGREDCLHLNVFVPSSASPSSPLPVMVHLHPGSNVFGRAYLDATAFVTRGVIVVTLNYRLGVFGFVGHPALSEEGGGSSGEYGVLDQIAALHWVQDNIAAFGGDPGNVTLFGASAGSFDTVAIMASPLAEGLLSRAAVQGDVFWAITGVHNQINVGEALGERIADSAGCGHQTDVLPCLRAAPYEDILVAATENGADGFTPYTGGQVLPKSPLELIAEGDGVPLLIGFDREEETPFLYPFPDPYPYRAWLTDTAALVGPQRAEQLRDLYPPSDYESLWWSYVTALTDTVRGLPHPAAGPGQPGPDLSMAVHPHHRKRSVPGRIQGGSLHGGQLPVAHRESVRRAVHAYAGRGGVGPPDDGLLDELRQDRRPQRPRPTRVAAVRRRNRPDPDPRQEDRCGDVPRRTVRLPRHHPHPVSVSPWAH